MAFASFEVELDDCTFLKGSEVIENTTGNSPGALALDYELTKDIEIELVAIKVKKEISGKEYQFYSAPVSNSVDDLCIRIVFFKSIVVHYNEYDPAEYYFDWK
jgi:hypothetical protein